MTNKNKLLLLVFVAANIFMVVGGVIAAENLKKAESVCPRETIIKGRAALALPECQKILPQEK
ncbi:MAG: hypothetical protein QNJ72_05105 [Pleurocapsa sp. MO_226.B13]|nr:hypothetical protein [Pleurocapsa sp. MO_226.B13]